MATRCNIMITSDWKTFAAAYCHWDGGLWGVGQTLDAMYNDTDTILDLVALGDMSTLCFTVEQTATYERCAYKESGGEVEMKDATEVFIPSAGEEYLYVWCTVKEKWYVGTYYTSTPNWKPLTIAIAAHMKDHDEMSIFGEDYTSQSLSVAA